jgi:PiT family inorganic phosphate transporter
MSSVAGVLAVALVASLFMSFTVGANSNSAPVAPAVGAGALSTLRAALLVGVVAGLGAVAQGGSISETIGEGLVTGVTITPLAAAATLLTAATLITVGNSRGYPIPSAFTVTGAAVGAGLALGGSFATAKYVEIRGFWFAIPVAEGVLAYGIARLLLNEGRSDTLDIAALAGGVGFALANIRLAFLGGGGEMRSVAAALTGAYSLVPTALVGSYTVGMALVSLAFAGVALGATYWQLDRDVSTGIDRVLVGLGMVVVFTSGGTQVGLATGPLEAIFETELGLPSAYLLALGGFGILLGGWIRSPRLIQAVAREYASLGPKRSIAALIPAFLIAQLAIVLGIPISFNKVMISSIVGSGLVGRSDDGGGVSASKSVYTVAAWVGSMVGGGAISYALYEVLSAVPGIGT